MNKKKIVMEIERRKDLVGNGKIVAIYLFGSVAEGKSGPMSDVDICIVDNKIDWKEKLEIMGKFNDEFDVSFFSDMPVWIKMRVLKGIPVVINDRDKLYGVGFETLREYEDIKPLLRERMLRRFGKCTI